MSGRLPSITEGNMEARLAEHCKFDASLDPDDLESSAAKIMGMFDELYQVTTIIRKVQDRNKELVEENNKLKDEVEEHKRAIRQLVTRNVWRQ